MLLRASIGMGIVIFTMAFVQNVYQLLGLRILQGVLQVMQQHVLLLLQHRQIKIIQDGL